MYYQGICNLSRYTGRAARPEEKRKTSEEVHRVNAQSASMTEEGAGNRVKWRQCVNLPLKEEDDFKKEKNHSENYKTSVHTRGLTLCCSSLFNKCIGLWTNKFCSVTVLWSGVSRVIISSYFSSPPLNEAHVSS